ncbi:MAG: hypothetical protein ACLQHM_11305 [Limisphaerales bacterium]
MGEVPSSAVSPFSQTFLKRVAPLRSAVKKISTEAVLLGQQVWMFHLPFHFVRDNDELKARFFRSNSSAVPAAEKLKP